MDPNMSLDTFGIELLMEVIKEEFGDEGLLRVRDNLRKRRFQLLMDAPSGNN